MKNALSPIFLRFAAKSVLGITLVLNLSQDAAAQQQVSPATRIDSTRGNKNVKVVTWGDSIGNGIGLSLGQVFRSVTNVGIDGSGLSIGLKPAPLPEIPKGAAVLMSIGTNDVEPLMGASDKAVDSYARQVIAVAQEVRKQGGIPIIIGMQAVLAPYTGNPKWSRQGYVENWNATMHRVNAAIEKNAQQNNIAWSRVQDRVADRKSDNLHYTDRGSRHIAENALRDAGISF